MPGGCMARPKLLAVAAAANVCRCSRCCSSSSRPAAAAARWPLHRHAGSGAFSPLGTSWGPSQARNVGCVLAHGHLLRLAHRCHEPDEAHQDLQHATARRHWILGPAAHC